VGGHDRDMKLPISKRPPKKEVFEKHFGHLPKDLIKFLVLDIQNDCSCATETYDSDAKMPSLILHPGRVELSESDQIVAPIHSERKIMATDLIMLYDWACELSNDPFGYFDFDHINKIGEKNGFEFIAPEPEFFGVLACNIGGWGAWCWPHQLLRKAIHA
jgi:hypothetical protein